MPPIVHDPDLYALCFQQISTSPLLKGKPVRVFTRPDAEGLFLSLYLQVSPRNETIELWTVVPSYAWPGETIFLPKWLQLPADERRLPGLVVFSGGNQYVVTDEVTIVSRWLTPEEIEASPSSLVVIDGSSVNQETGEIVGDAPLKPALASTRKVPTPALRSSPSKVPPDAPGATDSPGTHSAQVGTPAAAPPAERVTEEPAKDPRIGQSLAKLERRLSCLAGGKANAGLYQVGRDEYFVTWDKKVVSIQPTAAAAWESFWQLHDGGAR